MSRPNWWENALICKQVSIIGSGLERIHGNIDLMAVSGVYVLTVFEAVHEK